MYIYDTTRKLLHFLSLICIYIKCNTVLWEYDAKRMQMFQKNLKYKYFTLQ